jgi:hypothetical protein
MVRTGRMLVSAGCVAAWACTSILGVDGVRFALPDAAGDALGPADAAPEAEAVRGCRVGAGDAAACTTAGAPDSACTVAAEVCQTSLLVAAPEAGTIDGAPAATPFTFPMGIAVDDDYVYWTSQNTYDQSASRGAVRRASRAHPGAAETLAVDQPAPRGIAVDGTYVYWFTLGPGPLVQRLPKCAPACEAGACPDPERIATTPVTVPGGWLAAAGLDRVAVGIDTRLYAYEKKNGVWSEQNGHAFPPNQSPTFSRSSTGFFVAHGGQLDHLDFDLVPLSTITLGTGLLLLVSDCERTYVVESQSNVLAELLPDGGVNTIGEVRGDAVYALAADRKFVYVGYANNGGVYRLATDGSHVAEVLAPGSAWCLAVDESAIYWGEHGAAPADFRGEIYRLEK